MSADNDRIDTSFESKRPEESISFEKSHPLQARFLERRDTLSGLFEGAVESGEADQLRGYANEKIGEAKIAIARALESPELAVQGIEQEILGAIQRYVGEEKDCKDEEEKGE
jgi:hypothetical protein